MTESRPTGAASLATYAREKLAALEVLDRRRVPVATSRGGGAWVERAGRPLRSFSSNDYLGLAVHPEVRAAATTAIAAAGTSVSASPLVTGRHPLAIALERELARFKGTEDAVLFGSGFLANAGVVPALAGPGDAVVLDALAHASLWTGARLGGAEVLSYAHDDVAALDDLLTRTRHRFRHVVVATETVFSMDGDVGSVARLAAVARRHDAWLLADDAHGLGTLGDAHASTFAPDDVPLQMGTLSKALGAHGGYLAASADVCALVRNRARSYVYATGLPPATVAAARAALAIVLRDPALVARPLAAARRLTARLGLPPASSAIVPLVVGPSSAALAASRALEDAGFLVVAIRPPTVPDGTARLRVALTAPHDERDVDDLADALLRLGVPSAATAAERGA